MPVFIIEKLRKSARLHQNSIIYVSFYYLRQGAYVFVAHLVAHKQFLRLVRLQGSTNLTKCRDRDDSETFNNLLEKRPRRDVGIRLETVSRPRHRDRDYNRWFQVQSRPCTAMFTNRIQVTTHILGSHPQSILLMCLIKCRPLSISLAGRANGSAYSTPCVPVCPSVSLSLSLSLSVCVCVCVCGVGAMWLTPIRIALVSRMRVIT